MIFETGLPTPYYLARQMSPRITARGLP